MVVGLIRIRLALPSETLKEKRTIVKSVVERLRTRYNASVAEVEDLNDAGHGTIAAACVSNSRSHADSQLAAIAKAVQDWRLDAEVLSIETELIEA
jgi:uncharacterized protein